MEDLNYFIGKEIDILDDTDNVIKTITIAKVKNTSYGLIVIDTEGEVYTKDELNTSFLVSPPQALFDFLRTEGFINPKEQYNPDRYNRLFNALMEMLERQRILKKD